MYPNKLASPLACQHYNLNVLTHHKLTVSMFASVQSKLDHRLRHRFDAEDLYAVGNSNIPKVVFWKDDMIKAQSRALRDPTLRLSDRPDLTGEAHFPHHGPASGNAAVPVGRRDGSAQRQVRRGLRQRHAAGDVDVHSLVVHAQPHPLFQHRQQQGESSLVDAAGHPPRIAEYRGGNQRLDIRKEWP